MSSAWRVLVVLLVLAAAACRPPGVVRRAFEPPSPREQYETSLREAGLTETGLGRAWIDAGRRALVSPVPVEPPFREVGYFPPNEAAAVGYRLELKRGQRLTVEYEVQGSEPLVLFLDLFELAGEPDRVASAASGSATLDYEAERDAAYVLRLQPELLRGGRFVLTQRVAAVLAFPVPDAVDRVHSVFGDPRDAGVRSHEGIDIFAPRGTDAVAAADGVVRGAGTNRLGGNVVWVWDTARGLALYYAHLERATVRAGQQVKVGDTVGKIGNTGNAAGTSPHLHFGIYTFGSGAVDPLPFVVSPPGDLPAIPSDASALGERQRTARAGVTVGAAVDAVADGGKPSRLSKDTVVRVEALSGARARVRLPDGRPALIARRDLRPIDAPVRRLTPREALPVRDRPLADAAIVTDLAPGQAVPILGRFDDFLLVRDSQGREGWIADGSSPDETSS